MKIRTKIILLCVTILLLNSTLTGSLYYNYAFKDTLKNYYDSSEDAVSQMKSYLQNETQSITKRVHAVYNNISFFSPLAAYLGNPESSGYGKLLGDVADVITELQIGDRYIHSILIHTPYSSFDNFTRIRNHDFKFEESEMFQYFEKNPYETIGWFPAVESPMFTGTDVVIPVVYKFRMNRKNTFVIISMQQSEIEEYLNKTYSSYDKIFIADKNGNNIINYGTKEAEVLANFSAKDLESKNAVCKEITIDGKRYLATYTTMQGTGWQICALKSAESLVGNLSELRYYILLVVGVCAMISILLIIVMAHGLTTSLGKLSNIMQRVTKEDFKVKFNYPNNDEVGKLASSFNYMVEKINQLITELNINIVALKEEKETVKQVQAQKRRAELKALQAQINPHFLYNTLNAITWQATDQGASEISILSNSLGKFFRVSLSKGREIITIGEELEHVISYLNIQKIRYKDKINFEVDVPADVKDLFVIKLVLQPLVENAIYHGIRVKNTPGMIRISVRRETHESGVQILLLQVEDTGNGIEVEKLKVINEGLQTGKINPDSGYGIYNVNERIKLYYGESYGLSINSKYKQGTISTIVLPIQTTKEE